MRDVTAWRPTTGRSWSGRRHGAIPVLLATAILAAGCAGPNPSPSTGIPSSIPATPTGSQIAPTSSPAAWAKLDFAGLPEVARLEPTKSGAGGVAPDTAFRLTSLDGRAPEVLAARLVADPPITFKVASIEGTTALLRPVVSLTAGTTYRISLPRTDGSVEAAWAAQAASPLRIVETIPGNQATGVPVDAGIEITFDQYGVGTGDLERFFTIEPSVAGRFQAAGRTIAFVPASPMAGGRVYTVTIRHGLPLAGTGQVLATDRVVRFETDAKPASDIHVSFARPVVDASTTEQAALGLVVDLPMDENGNEASSPATVDVQVHRLADINAGIAAWRAVLAAPDWTRVTSTAPVMTAGLPRALSGTLRVQCIEDGYGCWIQLPKALAAGWYVVTLTWAGIARQVALQVTDLAAFALVAIDRSAIWVNDLQTRGPAVGASATLDGTSLGNTDARGLLVAGTPSAVAAQGRSLPAIVVVRHNGRSMFLPVSDSQVCGKCDIATVTDDDQWWHLFSTDRHLYRVTDTVNAWGVVRHRDTGKVPASVTVSLVPDNGDPATAVPIKTAPATPDATGSFSVRLSYRDLPSGDYRVKLAVGGTLIADDWLSVGPVVKPAYSLALSVGKHAIVDGGALTASVQAAFFEGTPVAGTELTLSSDEQGLKSIRTDSAGAATALVTPSLADAESQWQVQAVRAQPTLPEEAEITGTTYVAVFRSDAVIDTTANLSGTSLVVSGSVNDVVFDRYERAAPDLLWDVDPRGAGRRNALVSIQVTERIPVLTQTGTTYDFILKRVRPAYDVSEREIDLGTRQVRTAENGSYRISMTVRGGNSSYEIRATYTDAQGRKLIDDGWAYGTNLAEYPSHAWLQSADAVEDGQYSLGDTVRVSFTGGAADPPVARYLFAVTQRGLAYATVGTGATFRTTFDAGDVPSVQVSGVRFNGYGYEPVVTGYTASLRIEDRRLAVQLTPDRARYAPGETASVAIKTLGPNGKPVSASVFVRAVDEKLYAMGAAADSDPLTDLYRAVGSGIIGAVASHEAPEADFGGGGGDTTGGGGDRADFRDWLLARLLTTGADGTARVSIPLSDDLTSWRVTASGVDARLDAGIGTTSLPVGLPFFVDATVAPEYLSVDRPIIRVRAFGSGLRDGETVRFSVSSDSLPMNAVTVEAAAFRAAEVTLPALSTGTHRVRITATAGSGATVRTDTLVRTFQVVDTRATQGRTTWALLDAAMDVQPGTGLTTITLVDAGRGRVVPFLEGLAWEDAIRADSALAASLAARVLRDSFGITIPSDVTADDLVAFQGGEGVAIVAYGSADPDVTTLAAMTADPALRAAGLSYALHEVYDDMSGARDGRLLALAGLAALGEPVLADVRAASATADLTVAEQVSVALAALYAGDEALARQLERALLTVHGLRRGPWVRIDAGPRDDAAVQTARLAIVAASLGDPVAADMDAWLAENPPATTLVTLERALAARGWAERVPGADAKAAITAGGARREVAVGPGQPVELQLTPVQASGARLEPISGKVLVVTSREGALDPSSLSPARGQALTRTVTPAGRIGATDTVIVKLAVTLGPDAGSSCWRVTDLAPSGLAPISSGGTWEGDEEAAPDWLSPTRVVGQRVEFCAGADARHPVQTLRYVARVVTSGTYRWEPAVLQSEVVPTEGIALPATTVTIARLGG